MVAATVKSRSAVGQMAWERYQCDPTPENRNELVMAHLYLVQALAKRISYRISGRVGADELESDGVMGLIQAIDSYDPDRQTRFATFASQRVRGAMLDGLRARDDVPRLARERQTQLAQARDRLRSLGIERPTHGELANTMGLSGPEADRVLSDQPLMTWSLSARKYRAEGHEGRMSSREALVGDSLAAPEIDPVADLCRREFWLGLCKGLSREQRACLVLYWREGMLLREIGQTIGLTESRASQILAEAMTLIRDRMTMGEGPTRTHLTEADRPEVLAAVKELEPSERQIFLVNYADLLSLGEIAKVLGLTYYQAQKAMAVATRKLSRRLGVRVRPLSKWALRCKPQSAILNPQ